MSPWVTKKNKPHATISYPIPCSFLSLFSSSFWKKKKKHHQVKLFTKYITESANASSIQVPYIATTFTASVKH